MVIKIANFAHFYEPTGADLVTVNFLNNCFTTGTFYFEGQILFFRYRRYPESGEIDARKQFYPVVGFGLYHYHLAYQMLELVEQGKSLTEALKFARL